MMDLYRSLAGVLEIQIISADLPAVLYDFEQQGIEMRHIQTTNEITLILQIPRRQEELAVEICHKRGVQLQTVGRKGIYWKIWQFRHRPILSIGLLLMIVFGMYVPSRIFFVQVQGNTSIPQRQILEAAAECGIRFGANRRAVRSEKMKNALLEALPQLQWAGVNTSGCVAVISVRERKDPQVSKQDQAVGSIIAARDGVITQITAARGNKVCKVGQAVKAGEVLISGYTDCGISIRADRAEGEIFAQTERTITAVYPNQRDVRGKIVDQQTKYSLIIGKNRINFYFGSGIYGNGCVRMYEEKYLTLPGGFQLPVILVKETILQYETKTDSLMPPEGSTEDYARNYLMSQMVAGVILSETCELIQQQDAVILKGQYHCHEMIGQFRKEEIIMPNGANN